MSGNSPSRAIFHDMTIMKRFVGLFLFALAALVPFDSPVLAQDSVEDFYRGNIVELYVGFSVGGGYDIHGRLAARHLGRFIPGNPTVVPLNMDGAGGIKLANWLYNAAPKDGSVLGIVSRGIPFESLIGIASPDTLQFDPTKLTWIGSTSDEVSICASWHDTGIETFSDLYEKELIVGGVGVGVDTDIFPLIMEGVLGVNFRIISGYPGSAEIDNAMERGEVDGRCGWSWSSLAATRMDWVREGKINPLVEVSLRRHPDLQAMGVPWLMDMAETEEDRQILRLFLSRGSIGRPFIAPPDIPPERVAALQSAFAEMVSDAEFLAEAERMRLEISPLTGEQAAALIQDVYSTPAPIVERARAMLRP